MEEPPQQRGGDAEGRVGHHVERPTREPQVGRVGLDHDDGTAEPLTEVLGPLGVGLDGDHPSTDIEQR